MTPLALWALRVYRRSVGLAFAGRCKYHPSCSQYAIDALSTYGVLRGVVLTAWRLARCNPWSHGGVDYVQQQRLFRRRASETTVQTVTRS